MKGSELVGRTYKPMFSYFSSLKAAPGSSIGAFRVVADGYVTSDAGTGVVHQAPFFGEDDYRVCRKFGKLYSSALSLMRCSCPLGACYMRNACVAYGQHSDCVCCHCLVLRQ